MESFLGSFWRDIDGLWKYSWEPWEKFRLKRGKWKIDENYKKRSCKSSKFLLKLFKSFPKALQRNISKHFPMRSKISRISPQLISKKLVDSKISVWASIKNWIKIVFLYSFVAVSFKKEIQFVDVCEHFHLADFPRFSLHSCFVWQNKNSSKTFDSKGKSKTKLKKIVSVAFFLFLYKEQNCFRKNRHFRIFSPAGSSQIFFHPKQQQTNVKFQSRKKY